MDMHVEGIIFQGYAAELARRIRFDHPPFAVLDLRPESAFRLAHVPGSRHIRVTELSSFPEDTDENTEFFVLGADSTDPSVRSAALRLKELGARRVVELPGGFSEWAGQGLPCEAA